MKNLDFEKEITINMPQMAIEALSENWLFKDLGNNHWEMICKGLDTNSFNLKDEIGNRLYATFIRIRVQYSKSLVNFVENELLKVKANINRFGNSLYFSKIELNGNDKEIKAELLTSFSIRNNSDNSKLVKSQPSNIENKIKDLDTIPDFVKEYHFVKKGFIKEIYINNIKFELNDNTIFKTNYLINPYYDLNGVGLLYFASYQVINDYCEALYFNSTFKYPTKWEQSFFTTYRDIFYYANCNIDDEVIYKLQSFEYFDVNKVKLCSSLYRKSDNSLLAYIFVIKEKNII